MGKYAQQTYLAENTRHQFMSETIYGLPTIKANALEKSRLISWRRVIDGYRDTIIRYGLLNRQITITGLLITRCATFLTLFASCYEILNKSMTVGELLAIQILVARISGPLLGVGDIARQLRDLIVALDAVSTELNAPTEKAGEIPGARNVGPGGYQLSNVSFKYSESSKLVLKNINVDLGDASVVALVGKNGEGKSTLIRILLGLEQNYTGTVRLGGKDLRNYVPRELRKQIGIVVQDTVLLSGTIAENVGAGLAVDDDRLKNALDWVEARDFVDALPNGEQTELIANGNNLSGGQRQKLSLARSIIRDPKIVLWDEPTSFLDSESAASLERRLLSWGRNRLSLIVTHNLSTAKACDRILVLSGGGIVGDGNHDELLKACPVYEGLWKDYIEGIKGNTKSVAI